MAELRRVVTDHRIGTSDSHPFLLEPGDQGEELTVALEGVRAQVAEDRETGGQVTRRSERRVRMRE